MMTKKSNLICLYLIVLCFFTTAPNGVLSSESAQEDLSTVFKKQLLQNLIRDHGYVSEIQIIDTPDAKGKYIIHIRDLHCNEESQLNIALMLDRLSRILSRRNIVPLYIFLEGAHGIVDTSFFGSFPDKETRETIAGTYVRKGVLTGTEYFSICEYDTMPSHIEGIEDFSLYLDNLESFREVMNPDQQQLLKTWTGSIQKVLSTLKKEIYSEELFEIERQMEAHHKGLISFLDYLPFLLKKYNNYIGKDTAKEFPMIITTLSMLTIQKTIMAEKISSEQKALFAEFEKHLDTPTLKKLVKESLLFRLGKLAPERYYETLFSFAEKNKIDLEKLFPNLYASIQLHQLREKLNQDELLGELEKMYRLLVAHLGTSPQEKKLITLSDHFDRLTRLYGLAWTREDLAVFHSHSNDYHPEQITKSIEQLATTFSLPIAIDMTGYDTANRLFDTALRFYDIALERDQVLVENAKKVLEEKDIRVAVLISGGFHSEGILKNLEEERISYAVLIPKISQEPDTDLYFKRMMDQRVAITALSVPVLFSQTLEALKNYQLQEQGSMTKEYLSFFLKKLSRLSPGKQEEQKESLLSWLRLQEERRTQDPVTLHLLAVAKEILSKNDIILSEESVDEEWEQIRAFLDSATPRMQTFTVSFLRDTNDAHYSQALDYVTAKKQKPLLEQSLLDDIIRTIHKKGALRVSELISEYDVPLFALWVELQRNNIQIVSDSIQYPRIIDKDGTFVPRNSPSVLREFLDFSVVGIDNTKIKKALNWVTASRYKHSSGIVSKALSVFYRITYPRQDLAFAVSGDIALEMAHRGSDIDIVIFDTNKENLAKAIDVVESDLAFPFASLDLDYDIYGISLDMIDDLDPENFEDVKLVKNIIVNSRYLQGNKTLYDQMRSKLEERFGTLFEEYSQQAQKDRQRVIGQVLDEGEITSEEAFSIFYGEGETFWGVNTGLENTTFYDKMFGRNQTTTAQADSEVTQGTADKAATVTEESSKTTESAQEQPRDLDADIAALRALAEEPLDGPSSVFINWINQVITQSDTVLTTEELFELAGKLGIDENMFDSLLYRAKERAEYAFAFFLTVPADSKTSVYLLRDAFSLYIAETLFGEKTSLFYLSKSSFAAFTGNKHDAARIIPSLLNAAREALSREFPDRYNKQDPVPSDLFPRFKELFFKTVERELESGEFSQELHQAREQILTYFKENNFQDLQENGVRIIDSTKTGTLVLFLEALFHLEGIETDSKMFFSWLSPAFTYTSSENTGRVIESKNYPVEFNGTILDNAEPAVVEKGTDEEKAAFLLSLVLLRNELLEWKASPVEKLTEDEIVSLQQDTWAFLQKYGYDNYKKGFSDFMKAFSAYLDTHTQNRSKYSKAEIEKKVNNVFDLWNSLLSPKDVFDGSWAKRTLHALLSDTFPLQHVISLRRGLARLNLLKSASVSSGQISWSPAINEWIERVSRAAETDDENIQKKPRFSDAVHQHAIVERLKVMPIQRLEELTELIEPYLPWLSEHGESMNYFEILAHYISVQQRGITDSIFEDGPDELGSLGIVLEGFIDAYNDSIQASLLPAFTVDDTNKHFLSTLVYDHSFFLKKKNLQEEYGFSIPNDGEGKVFIIRVGDAESLTGVTESIRQLKQEAPKASIVLDTPLGQQELYALLEGWGLDSKQIDEIVFANWSDIRSLTEMESSIRKIIPGDWDLSRDVVFAMDQTELASFTEASNPQALKQFRVAVGNLGKDGNVLMPDVIGLALVLSGAETVFDASGKLDPQLQKILIDILKDIMQDYANDEEIEQTAAAMIAEIIEFGYITLPVIDDTLNDINHEWMMDRALEIAA